MREPDMLATLWRHSRAGQASAIVGRGKPCGLPKRCGERVGTAEANRQANFRHRDRPLCQQQLGMLYTTIGLVPMWRCTKRMLECPAEMPWTQTNELRQRCKRY